MVKTFKTPCRKSGLLHFHFARVSSKFNNGQIRREIVFMPYEEILYETADRIATITLNRPEKLNAWTPKMEQEVRTAMTEAERDNTVRVIVLTGAGRGFCAGADMQHLNSLASGDVEVARSQNATSAPREDVLPDFQKKYSWFPSIPKPIIGAINGPAVGLGFVISIYCDLRFASNQARFSTAFARRGLVAEHGISWLLPRLIGTANALDMLLSARLVEADEALRMGLVNRVIPHERMMGEVRSYATELSTMVSPRSMGVMKKQVWNAQFQTLSEAIDAADVEMFKSFDCADFKEGVAHFIEKRAPNFTGR
jgi:enoyl-CoA hydratase/carnithine racemase